MKNIFSILVGLLVVIGCKKADSHSMFNDTSASRYELDNTSEYYDQHYKVYTFEGCEYIVINSGSSRWGSHKGNCNNPIHECK